MSTESIASSSHSSAAVGESCAACGAPLAPDQRYCLECGERRSPTSSVLLGGPPAAARAAVPPASAPPLPPAGASGEGPWQRSTTLTVIAGVGVLLLAMGVGVLIGRAGGGKTTTAPAQVISVASTPSAGTGAGASAEATFTSSWPSGTSGFTVQLRTLPVSGTSVSAVEAAKTAAGAKGATAVGALKAEEFSSLHGENYVIYAGVYHTRAEAQKALAGLAKSFPGAAVIEVSNKAAGSSGTSGSAGSSGSGAGSSDAHPAPPSVLKNLNSAKGKSYEEKSKNLPDVVETG